MGFVEQACGYARNSGRCSRRTEFLQIQLEHCRESRSLRWLEDVIELLIDTVLTQPAVSIKSHRRKPVC